MIEINNHIIHTKHHTNVMGILNVTPDSFSDGGKYNSLDAALKHTEEMLNDGAVIIDIGGESTRPGYTMISDQEEIERVLPYIEAIKERFDCVLSLDTYKSKVAKAGVSAGVDIINDIWGLLYDEELAKVVADSDVFYILGNNRNIVHEGTSLHQFMEMIEEDVYRANHAGIENSKIILDPGVGFAKSKETDLLAISNCGLLNDFDIPVMLGTSRKSCLDYIVNRPKDERLAATLATTAFAVSNRIAFVRVHDVKENVDFIKMYEALKERVR